MYCTDGYRLVTNKKGELLIRNGLLYACDSFHCPACGKTVISGVADRPLSFADSKEADELIMRKASQGLNCYGR